MVKNYYLFLLRLSVFVMFFIMKDSQAQNCNVILGRPTDTSITANLLFDQNVDAYLEYGKTSGIYTQNTPTISLVAGVATDVDMRFLVGNTRYYYHVKYKKSGSATYISTPEYSFVTQRAMGETFTFTIEADEHLYDKKGVKNMYDVCLSNQAKDKPDFMITMGDIFGDDHNPKTITSSQLQALHADYRPFLGKLCHSIPFYVCLGNHEGEMDYWMAQTPPNNLAINATLWRKYYYPNPYPNSFYSGNQDIEGYGIGNPENYYAWTWGDAQFIVLDAYRDQCDSSAKPQGWNWSLGKPQYLWLKQTLESSTSKYKFVFCHHVRGQGRGGVTNAKLFEWGGYEQNGTSYTFDAKRPGWGKPIHQLFVDNGVNIFFQGHDHVFAHEVLDGVTYQALPMAADSTYEIGKLANADAYVSDTLDGTGHVRVVVSPSCVKVDYVKAYLPKDTLSGDHKNGEIGFSYSIGTCPTGNSQWLEKDGVKVFPNPSSKLVSVLFRENIQNPKMNLYSTTGKLVMNIKSKDFDVSNLENGIYFLKIESSNTKTTTKIIVNH